MEIIIIIIIRGEVVHSAACFLGLSQHNLTIQNKNLLDLVFDNFSCVNITISNLDLVEPDTLHPSLVIDLRSVFLSTFSIISWLRLRWLCIALQVFVLLWLVLRLQPVLYGLCYWSGQVGAYWCLILALR
jgi:hypothetical protein